MNSIEREKQSLNSIIGIQFESFCASLLKRIGFDQVHVTPATRDYGIDILGKINFHGKLGIQCKHVNNKKRKIGYRAIEEVQSGVKYYHLQAGVILTNGYFTHQAQKSAKKMHITLWDDTVLYLLIKLFEAYLTFYNLMDYEDDVLPLVRKLMKKNS